MELKASKSHLFRKLKKKEIFVSTKLFQFFHNNTQIGQILFEAANSKKRYIRLQGKILNFIHFNNIFRRTMNILIVFDIIILSIDNFPVDSSYSYILETIDFTIFLIYCIELLLKIYSYGIKMFIKNPFYCLDLLLIISHVFQYSYQSYLVSFTNHYSFRNVMLQNSYSGSFIKPAKIFRIFEGMYYSKFFASFSILFKAFLNSLIKMKFFILNSVILILMIALLGKELFAYEVRKLEGQKWIEPDDL